MQLLEPVIHVAESAEQLQARFGQVKCGIEGVLVFLAFIDAGELFRFGGELGRCAWAASAAVAEFKLREHGLELLVGDLLFEAGNFGQRIQLSEAASQRGDLYIVLALSLFLFDFGAEGFGGILLLATNPVDWWLKPL